MMAREPGAKLADIAPMRNRELLRVKTKKKTNNIIHVDAYRQCQEGGGGAAVGCKKTCKATSILPGHKYADACSITFPVWVSTLNQAACLCIPARHRI